MTIVEPEFALERDQNLVDSILENIGSSNMRAFRYKTVMRMNPYMANNPSAVAAMANMPISTSELMGQAGAIYGMQTANRLASDLGNYSDSVQRSIFAGLTPEQQQTLTQMGYSLPERTIENNGWFNTLLDVGLYVPKKVMGGLGQTVGPVISPALDALATIGDFTFGKPYRTISQLSGVDQWLSLIAGVGVTAAGLLLMPTTAGASSSLIAAYWGGNIARVGLAAQAGLAAATATSFVSSSIQNGGTGVWTNAWSNAWNGEKLFRNDAVNEASTRLADPTLVALAQDFAATSNYPGELIDIAKTIAGQRDSTNQNLQFAKVEEIATKYAGKDSPLYESVYKSLVDLINEPVFQDAVRILENGKISMGRDIANFLGLDPSSGMGRWVSGGIDATSLLVFDPFNQVAGGLRAIAQTRRGLNIADGINASEKFADILLHKSMKRKMDVVLEAVNKADAQVLRKGAQEWRPILPELVNHRIEKGVDLTVNDVAEFITGQQKFAAIMNGIGVIKGSNYHQLKHLSLTEATARRIFNPLRDVLSGISDVRAEVKNFPRIISQMQKKDPEAAKLFMERLVNVDDEVVQSLVREWGMDENAARVVASMTANPELAKLVGGVDDIYENARNLFLAEEKDVAAAKAFFAQATEDLSSAYRLGRLLGRTPAGMALRPLASFIDGVGTQIPRGAVHIVGHDAPDSIRNYVEMFRTIGVPSYIRNQWTNTITMAPNGASRLIAANAMLDSFATAFGMRFTERGSNLLDEYLDRLRQMYGYGETARRSVETVRGLTDSFPVGVRPVEDMATMFAIPNLIEVRNATRMGVIMRMALGVSESVPVTAFQNRFWKPAVLLRMGFFLRNASEEMLALMVRYGSGRWGQETASRMIGERAVYRETRERAAQYSHASLSPIQQYKLERNTHLPGPLRAAGRVLDRMQDSYPTWGSIERLKNWMFRSFDSILGEGLTIRRLPGSQFDLVVPEGGVSGLEGILINGLLGNQSAIRQGMKSVAKPAVDTYGARAIYNLQTLWRRLAFGDTYSLRRMVLGGIDDRLMYDAMSVIANNDSHFRAVMSHVGTSKLATWATYGGDDVTKQIVINENGSASYELVHMGSNRRLSQQGQQAIGEQPWDAATLEGQQRWIEDPFGKEAFSILGRYFNSDIEQVISRDELYDILQEFGNSVFGRNVHIDKDLWHLYLHSFGNQRVFRRELFDSYLAQMIKSDEAIETLGRSNPKLADWARNRNEIIRNLQIRFPGNTTPTWREISEVIAEDSRLLFELDKKFVTKRGYFVEDIPEEGLADQVVPQYELITESGLRPDEIDVTNAPILESFGFKAGYSKIRSQLDLLDRLDQLRSALPEEAQDYVNRMLATWAARPDYLDLALVNGRGASGISPFIESMDDLEAALRASFRNVSNDPELARAFNLNPDFIGRTSSRPVYVIDFSRSPDFDQTDIALDALSTLRNALENRNIVFAGADQDQLLYEAIEAGFRNKTPVILTNQELADAISTQLNRWIDVASKQAPRLAGRRVTLNQAEIPDALFEGNRIAQIADLGTDELGASALLEMNLDEVPVLWDNLEPLLTSAGGDVIEERAIRAFLDDVRSGRRTQLVYKQSGGQLYRNQLGEAVPLQDGEIIQSTTPLYTNEKMRKADQVFPGQNMRYFKMETPTYVGQSEIRWPTVDAILFDEARKASGSRAFQLNNPKMLPPTKSRQAETIAINRRELHYAGTEHVKLTPQGDLPDWQIVQVYELRPKNLFDEVVRGGFGVIGKMIDTVSREPMAFHSLLQSIERNRNIRGWVISSSKQEAALRDTVVRVAQATNPETTVPKFFDNWSKLARAAAEMNNASSVGRWDDLQALSYIRGLDDDEFELFLNGLKDRAARKQIPSAGGIADFEVDGLVQFARITRDKLQASLLTDSTDGFIGHIDRMFGEGSAWLGAPKNPINTLDDDAKAFLDQMTKEDWTAIRNSARQRLAHNEENLSYAAEQAVRDIMPFVDSHEFRSQFAETARGFLPFWYAEENFLKRWARIFSEGGPVASLARIRRLQLQYMGLRSAGVIRTDTQGKDYFVWPGSSLFVEALDKLIPGNERIPVETFLQTPTSNLVPGFNENFGTPAAGPLVALPLSLAAGLNPEVMPIKRAIVGDTNVFRSIVDNIIPTHWKRFAEAANLFVGGNLPESGNARVASAMMTAIANLDAIGGIPDDMTAEQQDEVLRTVREHTKVILMAQAIAGIIGPGTTSLLETPEGSTLSWLTDGQIENPADLFSASYYELISNLGIEEGTLAYLEAYKNSPFKDMVTPEGVLAYTVSKTTSASGAPLPSTEKAWAYYESNQDFFEQYPEAAPWLMPQDENNDERSNYAYNQELIANLRTKRTPLEFLQTIKYKEGAQWYFTEQEKYETAIRNARKRGQDATADRLRNIWEAESQAFKLTHPVFAQMLVSGEARERRNKIITQMRYLLDDPAFPKTDHFDALKELQDAFDAFIVARGQLSINRTMFNQTRLSALKLQFATAVEAFILENPAVRPYWQTVLKPESGLD